MLLSLSLPELLRNVREARGYSARALSHRAGLSDAYVGKIESGALDPSLKSFLAIVEALELNDREIIFCLRLAQEEFSSRIAT